MATFTAVTTVPGQAAADLVSAGLERLIPAPTGVGIFEQQDGSGLWEISGYFAKAPDDADLALLALALDAQPFAVSALPETDWVAHVRRALSPVVAGRFFVYGSHDADKVPDDVVPLAIDAALAFGTGHHATTKGCLVALDRLANRGVVAENIADIGCGTAVLAMAAAKIWPLSRIIAGDIDEVAVQTAQDNLGRNGLDGAFLCVVATGFDQAEILSAAPFDLVFANILKAPLLGLAPDMGAHIGDSGRAILSGLLTEQADEILAAYRVVGFSCQHHDKLGEWSTLTLEKGAS